MSLKKNQIQLVFLDLAKSDINNLILDFNLQYDYFLYGDTSKLIRMAIHDKEFQDSLNSFKIFISDRYQNYLIKYLHMYIRYEIALIEQMAHQSKGDFYKTYLHHTYLKKNEIAYSNDAYMQFFNLFYKKPLSLVEMKYMKKSNSLLTNIMTLTTLKTQWLILLFIVMKNSMNL